VRILTEVWSPKEKKKTPSSKRGGQGFFLHLLGRKRRGEKGDKKGRGAADCGRKMP